MTGEQIMSLNSEHSVSLVGSISTSKLDFPLRKHLGHIFLLVEGQFNPHIIIYCVLCELSAQVCSPSSMCLYILRKYRHCPAAGHHWMVCMHAGSVPISDLRYIDRL